MTNATLGPAHFPRARRLVCGAGTYVGDLRRPGTLHVGFVRSPLPSADVVSMDPAPALAMAGVRAVLTGAELNRRVRPLRIDGPGLQAPDWFPLASDRVLYEGEPVAAVVAEDPYLLADAVDSVYVEWSERAPLLDVREAMAPAAPGLHAGAAGNLLFDRVVRSGDPEQRIAAAPIVLERTFHNARQTPLPLETRGVVAEREPGTGRLTLWTSTQIPHIVRAAIAEALGREESSVRVITPDVGGGFGAKSHVFSEEIVLAILAETFSQPLQWIETRREHFLATSHARDQTVSVRIGATTDGRLLAADIDVIVDVGAASIYPYSANLEPMTTGLSVLSAYDVPAATARVRAVGTNKTPLGAYRGVGGPFGNYCGERMLDLLAATIGCDRAEIRRRNLIPATAMPYTSWSGAVYDSGDYDAALREVWMLTEAAGWPARIAAPAEQSREVLGMGVAVFNEHSGTGSRAYRARGIGTIPGFDAARVVMEPSGATVVYVSSAEAGQDHEEMYRRIVARELGAPIDRIRVVEGDTDRCPPGTGTFSSRAGTAHAAAVTVAARRLQEQLRDLAATALRCSRDAVVLVEGGFAPARGGPGVGFDELAKLGHLRSPAAHADPERAPWLEATAHWDPEPTYPYGAQVAIVAVDRETLMPRVLEILAVEDCGVVVDEGGAERQVVGGIAMGLGDALLGELAYGEEGHLLSSSLVDYLVPMIDAMPRITIRHLSTPTDLTPLGTKGVAESGTTGAVAAIGTAVADALLRMGVDVDDLPASPTRLFDASRPTPM